MAPSKVAEKNLFVSLLFMLKNLFYESFLTIKYILGYKIKVKILVNILVTGFSFINEKFAKIICEKLEIQL